MKKRIILALAAVLAVLLAIFVGVTVYNAPAKKLAEQLDLGNRYLEEMNYEQAEIAFTKAIEIDPMSADAHLGLVETYIREGEFEKALEPARKGYELTGDERLKEKADMIESGDIFDSLGRPMKRTGYDENGNVAWWHVLTYNLKGQEASVTAYDAAGNETGKIEETYDEEGNMIDSYWWNYDAGEIGLYKYIYQDGRLVRKEQYDDTVGNILHHYIVFEYDDNGRAAKEVRYDADGTMRGYDINEYNNGQILKRISYYDLGREDEDFTLDGEHIYKYDEQGNLIRYEYYDAQEQALEHYEVYEYDEGGNLISRKAFDGEGNLQLEE